MNEVPYGAAAYPTLNPLHHSFEQAAQGHYVEAAREAGESFLSALDETRRETLYTLFRLAVRHGTRDEAYAALDRTLAADWWDFQRMLHDEELGDLRQADRFRTAVRGAWARSYIAMLERPEREAFQAPDRVMATLGLRPGDRVAEVGGGSGYFTVRLAQAVRPEGRVLTTDIRQEMLDHIQGRLEREGIVNVTLKLVAPDEPGLPAEWADLIFVTDTIHYVRPLDAFARRLAPALRPGGRVVVIDYTPKTMEERPWGPPPEQQVSLEEMHAAMATAGCVPYRVHGFLAEQYFAEYAPGDPS